MEATISNCCADKQECCSCIKAESGKNLAQQSGSALADITKHLEQVEATISNCCADPYTLFFCIAAESS